MIILITVASYTLNGGFLAESRTDVFQEMLISCIVLPAVLIISSAEPFLRLGDRSATFFNPLTDQKGATITLMFILSMTGWTFGTFGA